MSSSLQTSTIVKKCKKMSQMSNLKIVKNYQNWSTFVKINWSNCQLSQFVKNVTICQRKLDILIIDESESEKRKLTLCPVFFVD